MSEAGYEILSIDDLDRFPGATNDAPILLPLRRRVGFRPFGVNCWTAAAVGSACHRAPLRAGRRRGTLRRRPRPRDVHRRRRDLRRDGRNTRPRSSENTPRGFRRRGRDGCAGRRREGGRGLGACTMGGLPHRLRDPARRATRQPPVRRSRRSSRAIRTRGRGSTTRRASKRSKARPTPRSPICNARSRSALRKSGSTCATTTTSPASGRTHDSWRPSGEQHPHRRARPHRDARRLRLAADPPPLRDPRRSA